MPLGLGLIGCGNLGSYIMDAVAAGEAGDFVLRTVVDIPAVATRLQAVAQRHNARWGHDILSADLGDVDLVVEAANQDVVRRTLVPLLEQGKDVMIMSVGALADGSLLQAAAAAARRGGRKVYLPSGAIGGLDALRSAARTRIDSVVLTTRKPPAALKGAPFVEEHGIELDGLIRDTEIFAGTAVQASAAFPANLNVAVLVSLAGIGPERTQVRVVACPGLQTNVHEIEARGDFGAMRLQFENVPSPQNPKTSYLAALSALSTLRGIGAAIPGIA